MAKLSKRRQAIEERIEHGRAYAVDEAVALLSEVSKTKFNEAIDVAINLGVDPRKSDQVVRGATTLPHGTGKTVRVLVFASGEKVKEAEEAGADFVGGEELAQKVEGGWMDFDAVVSTPDMMKVVGKLGRVLGPRGLMPNPKSGTVTFEVAKAIDDIKGGKVEYRVDKASNLHAPVGKASFDAQQLQENAHALFGSILRNRPAAAKGKFIRSVYLSTTMGPGIQVDASTLTSGEA